MENKTINFSNNKNINNPLFNSQTNADQEKLRPSIQKKLNFENTTQAKSQNYVQEIKSELS